jgi:hypothetical protein
LRERGGLDALVPLLHDAIERHPEFILQPNDCRAIAALVEFAP